jgi:transposase
MELSPELKLDLERQARCTKDVHERLRLCVILARSEGMSPESIAQAHRISVKNVYRYLAEYEAENKTQHEPRGGTESKLNVVQTQELLDHLQKNTYLKAKSICKYVKETYGIEYSIPGMIAWLKKHDFAYKEPIKVPGKLDPAKQEAFIEKYEELKTNLGEDEELYFLDAVHPEFQSQSVCGWIKKGETKTLSTTSKQFRLHFVGAIALKNMQVISQEYKTVNAENMVEFLKHLEASSSASKIHIICDNGRSNKNKLIQAYLQTSKIQIHYLPPYSPNLNPIERLWKIMREMNTYNRCYDTFENFSKEIRKFFFEDISKMVEILEKRINDKFQRIVLNSIVIAATKNSHFEL